MTACDSHAASSTSTCRAAHMTQRSAALVRLWTHLMGDTASQRCVRMQPILCESSPLRWQLAGRCPDRLSQATAVIDATFAANALKTTLVSRRVPSHGQLTSRRARPQTPNDLPGQGIRRRLLPSHLPAAKAAPRRSSSRPSGKAAVPLDRCPAYTNDRRRDAVVAPSQQ